MAEKEQRSGSSGSQRQDRQAAQDLRPSKTGSATNPDRSFADLQEATNATSGGVHIDPRRGKRFDEAHQPGGLYIGADGRPHDAHGNPLDESTLKTIRKLDAGEPGRPAGKGVDEKSFRAAGVRDAGEPGRPFGETEFQPHEPPEPHDEEQGVGDNISRVGEPTFDGVSDEARKASEQVAKQYGGGSSSGGSTKK